MLKQNLERVFEDIKGGNNLGEPIILVGATKMVTAEVINQAVEYGLKYVAENKVTEFREKHGLIQNACEHFIGHLQTNKVKYLVGQVELIHSVDSFHLAQEISNCAVKKGLVQDVLVQIIVGKEPQKGGFMPEDAFLAVKDITALPNLNVKGLMAMLPLSDNQELLKNLCLQMREIFDTLKNEGLPFKNLSVGMSGDYKIAIENGSNMVRIGSLIFGKRNYGEEK